MTLVSFVKATESYRVLIGPSISKPRMTLVSFVKTTESYEVCPFGQLYPYGPKRAGPITASDQTMQAVHSCNSSFLLLLLLLFCFLVFILI